MAKKPTSSGDARPDADGNGGAEAAGGATAAPGAAGAPEAASQQGPQLVILAQFIRDLSFESPNSPKSLQQPGANPNLDLNVNVQATRRGDQVFEVALHFEAKGASDDGVIYSIELVYAGLFRLANIPENVLQGVLFVDCPTLLFPFMRRIVADLSQDGGFPPLLLNPVDFASLYRRNMAQQAAGQAAAPGPIRN